MTSKEKWKIAKWINRYGPTERKNVPSWVPRDLLGNYDFFYVTHSSTDAEGVPLLSSDDKFEIGDSEMDPFALEHHRRIHEFRDWLEPAGVIVATVISVISFVLSLIALFNG